MSNLFIAVRDTNRKLIRGLWQRGDKYYLQVRVPGESAPRKFPLDATSLSEAKSAAELRRTELRKGNVPTRGHKPGFSDFAEKYLQVLEKSERSVKVARTIREERRILEKWKGSLINTRIDKVTKAQIAAYRDARPVEEMVACLGKFGTFIIGGIRRELMIDQLIGTASDSTVQDQTGRRIESSVFCRKTSRKSVADT